MKRRKDAVGCLFSFLALALFIFCVPAGIWLAFTQRSLVQGLVVAAVVVAFVAVLAGLFLLGFRLTGATGGFFESIGANKTRIGPPPEWHLPSRGPM